MTHAVSQAGLADPLIVELLAEIYATADQNDDTIIKRAYATAAGLGGAPSTAQVTQWCGDAALPVRPEVGRLLYLLVRMLNARSIVEFGTSFGASLVYLAAAVRDSGNGGLVIGSELHAGKAAQARANLDRVRLGEFARVIEGDALETLAELPGPFDLILLDGWKELYLPVLELLEPQMRPGTVIVADNLNLLPEEYLAKVRDPGHGYASLELPLGDGIEVSLRLGSDAPVPVR